MVNVVTVRPRKGDADDELSVEISEARVSVLKAAIKETFELQTVSFDLFYAYTGSQSTTLNTLKPTPDVKLKTILSKCSNPTTDLIFFFQPHPFRFKVVFEAGGDPLVLEVEDLGVKELRSEIIRCFPELSNFMLQYDDDGIRAVLNSDSTLERVYTEATSKKVLPSVFVITAQNPNTSIIPTTVTSKPKIISTTQDISSEKSFDVMLSYSWSTKHLVKSLHTSLLQHTPTLRIWIDDREMDTDIYKGMVEGVLKSSLLLICLSRAYLSSANCNREIKFAADLQKPMVPVRMFDKMAGDDVGALMASRELAVPFLITSGLMYVDFEGLVPGTEGWEGAVRAVVEQVESRLAKVSGSGGGGVVKRAGIEEEDGVGRVLLKNWLQPVDFSVDLENYEAEYVVGTREWVDSVVLQWRESNERVLWVNGGAGTGKSIIAFRLSKFQPDGFKLGSVFFCRHNDEQKNSPEKVVASMAWDLASRFPVVKAHMEAVMDQNILEVAESGKSSLISRPIEAFQSLIIGGLNILGEHHKQMNTPYNETILLIVDALDECDPKSRHLLLKILSQSCEALPEFVKVFVTARPDLDIFNSLTKTDPFVLKTTSKENWDDIEKFIATRFASIWKLSVDQLQQNQELTECVKELVVKSEGVFIYARNACELLSNGFQFADPKAMLKEIQNLDFGPDSIYSVILNREFLTEQDLDEFRHVFGTILGVKEPVSLPTLMVVGTLTSVETGRVVSKLRSILKIEQGIVSVIHKSLKDFLTDNKRCGQNFFVNLAEVNHEHTLTCLDLMNKQLKYNMANLDASKEYKYTESNFAIDKDLEYACIFWGEHVTTAVRTFDLITPLLSWCKTKLCFWVEIMLLMGKMYTIISTVDSVSSHLSALTDSADVRFICQILNDVKRACINFRTPLLFNPLHLYKTVLTWAPQESMLFETYQISSNPKVAIGALKNWGPLTFEGHTIGVLTVKFYLDGKRIASGAKDNTIRLWNASTGECLQVLEGHTDRVNAIAISKDSRWLVSGSSDTFVKVFDLWIGDCVVTLAGHTAYVTSVQISADGSRVYSSSLDGIIKVWDVNAQQCLATFVAESVVYWISVSHDDEILAAALKDKSIKIFNLSTNSLSMILKGHEHGVRCVEISSDKRFLVSASTDCTLKSWSLESGKCTQTIEAHDFRLLYCSMNKDNSLILSTSTDKTCKVWDLKTGQLITVLEGHANWVLAGDWSPTNDIVTAGNDTTLKVWGQRDTQPDQDKSHTFDVTEVSASQDNKYLASASKDKTIRVWDVTQGRCVSMKSGHKDWVNTIAISRDSQIIASGGKDQTIKVWSSLPNQPACLRTLTGHSDYIKSVAISSDNKRIVSGSNDSTVKLWSVETGICLKTFHAHSGLVTSVAFSPDDKYVLSAGRDSVVRAWSLETGECVFQVSGDSKWCKEVGMCGTSDNLFVYARFHHGDLWKRVDEPDTFTVWSFKTKKRVDRPLYDVDGTDRYGLAVREGWLFNKGHRVCWLPDSVRGPTGMWMAQDNVLRLVKGNNIFCVIV